MPRSTHGCIDLPPQALWIPTPDTHCRHRHPCQPECCRPGLGPGHRRVRSHYCLSEPGTGTGTRIDKTHPFCPSSSYVAASQAHSYRHPALNSSLPDAYPILRRAILFLGSAYVPLFSSYFFSPPLNIPIPVSILPEAPRRALPSSLRSNVSLAAFPFRPKFDRTLA